MSAEIFLYGLGAVGAVYAYILDQAPGTLVTVCGRSNFTAVSEQGMELQSAKYGHHKGYKFHQAVKTPSDPSIASSKYSYVVCANKAILASPPVEDQLAPVIGKDTIIVLIQNGVGNEEPFRAKYPNHTILSGVTWVGANQPRPGLIVHNGKETMQFGCHYAENLDRAVQEQHLSAFVKLLVDGGTNVEVVPSIDLWRWKKTIWNCTWNTLTALTLCNTAQYLKASDSGKIVARQIIDEMTSIARALGHNIEEEYLTSLIERPQVQQGIYSSMCMDANAGRPMEVDVIIGVPLRKARALGLSTPTLETINALISSLDWRFRNGVTGPRL
ncbi:2-dehydropantoate 2-reductase [Mycena floridula]|nr:2-dehydropantoate 2-reductase [Mycena floridula]